ncbi:MAG: hypothetical protein ACYSR4_09570, partial [Planctomycetota bacterium]
MTTETDMLIFDDEKSPVFMGGVLIEQIKWMIRLRWLAVVGIVFIGMVCTKVFPVLISATPIYLCAGLTAIFNLVYFWIARKRTNNVGTRGIVFAMVQGEVDLVILTVMLHFSGGITNPFVLFYVFHIIIATIILPRTLSFSVGISAILMYGLMAVGEMNGWQWLRHHPLGF